MCKELLRFCIATFRTCSSIPKLGQPQAAHLRRDSAAAACAIAGAATLVTLHWETAAKPKAICSAQAGLGSRWAG